MAKDKELDKTETDNSRMSMDVLSGDEKFPDPSENAINAVSAKLEEKAAIEENSEEEKPKLKKDGTVAKKRGRKPGVKSGDSKLHNPREPKQAAEHTEVSSLYAAQVTSGILEQMQVMLISKDFQYSPIEREGNIKAWEATFDHYGGVQLTPPQALMLSHAGIIASRFGTSSETKSKLGLVKAWAKNKISKFKNRKNKNALSDTGANDERENNVREKESKEPEKTDGKK